MTSIIFQGHSILRVQNCRQLYLKPYSGVVLPMIEIVLSELLHLAMMKICRSVGNSFLKTIKDNTLEFSFIITEIQTFLEPVFDAIVNEKEWQEQWNFIMKWNKNERSPKL